MGLLRTLFWVALFLASTFAFTVLFEHGFENFGQNAQSEWAGLVKMYHSTTGGSGGAAGKTGK